MIKNRKPIIISISGYSLTNAEINILKSQKPWGVILFKRNILSFDQTKKLTKSIREVMKDKFYPILVDEEGGKVSRLSNLFSTKEFSQKFFGNIYEINKKKGLLIYKYYLETISNILVDMGININTVPVLDLLQSSTHTIIQERSYSSNLKTIKHLGKFCISFFKDKKIGTVAKHAPGHGSANADSHKKLPIVYKSTRHLYKNDFAAFNNLNCHFLMTAHVLYKKIDSKKSATISRNIINKIIRKKLKYKGIIISDDISMKALSKDIVTNAKRALNAGCNLVLHCSGDIKETTSLLNNLNTIDKFTRKKTHHFYEFLR